MNTRTIRDVKILLPELDPADLLEVAEAPGSGPLVDALVTGAAWEGWEFDDDIRQSRFLGVALTDASFQAATIAGCGFERVDLSGSRWRNVTLDRTVFKDCRLSGAHLTGVHLRDVVFEECRLDYATLDQLQVTSPAAFIGCTFTEATVSRTTMPQAILDRCLLTRTELVDCNLRDTDLRGSDLSSITGLGSLTGARVTSDQLAELVGPLAHYLRLQVSPLDE